MRPTSWLATRRLARSFQRVIRACFNLRSKSISDEAKAALLAGSACHSPCLGGGKNKPASGGILLDGWEHGLSGRYVSGFLSEQCGSEARVEQDVKAGLGAQRCDGSIKRFARFGESARRSSDCGARRGHGKAQLEIRSAT